MALGEQFFGSNSSVNVNPWWRSGSSHLMRCAYETLGAPSAVAVRPVTAAARSRAASYLETQLHVFYSPRTNRTYRPATVHAESTTHSGKNPRVWSRRKRQRAGAGRRCKCPRGPLRVCFDWMASPKSRLRPHEVRHYTTIRDFRRNCLFISCFSVCSGNLVLSSGPTSYRPGNCGVPVVLLILAGYGAVGAEDTNFLLHRCRQLVSSLLLFTSIPGYRGMQNNNNCLFVVTNCGKYCAHGRIAWSCNLLR